MPLGDFAAQGVDLTQARKLELRFGGPGKPATGSIELADVRFQESVDAARRRCATRWPRRPRASIVEDTPRAPAGSVPDVVRVAAAGADAARRPPRRVPDAADADGAIAAVRGRRL